MKAHTAMLLAVAAASAITLSSRGTFAEPYLFDLLADPAYYNSWNALLAGETNVDSWLARYAETRSGPATPGTTIQLGEAGYQVNMVCKTHECGDNQFVVLFSPNGTRAWGLLLKDRKTERFFGDPDEEKEKALRAAAHNVDR